ncbi:hypothetical protein EDB85DRAFT_2150570 [Lactarius pseudohatsudake]|nr:hypothetical protein EDB85DRAFT_2150570 [Lactarius pseudohatsudake]
MSSASTFDEPVIDYDELAGSDDIGTYPIDPSPSSLLPSGVSIETVARLTHDELLHNTEFAKQVRLVAALQELLEFRSKTTPNVVGPLRPDCSTRQVRANSGDLPLPHPRPTIRPAHYPEKVLWTLADCKVDASRPPMLRAIRREDGTLVSDDDWKAMRQSAVLIVRTRIQPLDVTPYYKYFTEQVEKSNAKGAKKSGKKPGESTTQQAKVKKTFYKRFFFKEWFAALQELESAVPLMSLCAGYWKADMTLGLVLPDIRVDLPTPATSHVGTSSRAATPSNASRAPHSQSSIPPPARSQSSRPPPAPRSQSSMPPPAPHVRSSVPSRTTRPRARPVASGPATPPSPCPTPSDSSRAAASRSEPSACRDSSKAPQPSASRAPPAKKAGTKGKRKRDPKPTTTKRWTKSACFAPTRFPLDCQVRRRASRASEIEFHFSLLGSANLTHHTRQVGNAGWRSRDIREEAGADDVAARQRESSPLPPSHPTTPKPMCVSSAPTTPYTPVSYEESQVEPNYDDLDQDNGNGDDEGNKHGDGESGSGDGDDGDEDDGDGDGDGLLATLKRDDLIAWIAAHNIEPQGKRATKKEIIKAIMAAAKSEHPSKEDVEEIIESRQAKRNARTA